MDFLESKETSNGNDNFRYLNLIVTVFISLLCFFIILNVLSSANTKKYEQLNKSITSEFKENNFQKELKTFEQKNVIGSESKKNEQTFRDIITELLSSVKNTIDNQYYETATNYVVQVNINSFFGPESNKARPTAQNFLNFLNKSLNSIKKQELAFAKLVLPYDLKNQSSYKEALSRLKHLNNDMDKDVPSSISFSLIPVDEAENSEKLNNIYIYFGKNEF